MAELRFDGKAAIVTGGGRGLGRAYARLLGARGCQVLVNDPGVTTRGTPESAGAAEQVAEEIRAGGGLAVADRNSVVDRADVVVEHALDEFGRLDVVINNAGITGGGAFDEMPAADFDLLVDTHYGGAVRVSRAAWPHLKQSGAGRIVNMSSASVFGTPFTSPYVSSKAGIFGLTRALAAEGAYSGIGVNAVMPAAYTRMTAQLPDDDGSDCSSRPGSLRRRWPRSWCSSPTRARASTARPSRWVPIAPPRVFLAECPGVVGDGTPEAFAGAGRRAAQHRRLGDPVGHDGRGALLLRPPRARRRRRVPRGSRAATPRERLRRGPLGLRRCLHRVAVRRRARVRARPGRRPRRSWSQIVFGSYDTDSDHAWHRLERGELTFADALAVISADARGCGHALRHRRDVQRHGRRRRSTAPW